MHPMKISSVSRAQKKTDVLNASESDAEAHAATCQGLRHELHRGKHLNALRRSCGGNPGCQKATTTGDGKLTVEHFVFFGEDTQDTVNWGTYATLHKSY